MKLQSVEQPAYARTCPASDLARVVADVLKPADCEWHLRTGKATRTDDLQKVER